MRLVSRLCPSMPSSGGGEEAVQTAVTQACVLGPDEHGLQPQVSPYTAAWPDSIQ